MAQIGPIRLFIIYQYSLLSTNQHFYVFLQIVNQIALNLKSQNTLSLPPQKKKEKEKENTTKRKRATYAHLRLSSICRTELLNFLLSKKPWQHKYCYQLL